jgi:hypothetical protein
MRIIITEQQFNSLLLNEGAPSLWWKEIKQAVKLVDNIGEFEITFNDLYDKARKQGLVGYIKTLFYDKMTPEQIKQEIIDGDYKGRKDLKVKNRRLYNLSVKISKKYNLMKGIDDILTQVFPDTHQISWTPELIRQEFKKGDYNSRSDLQIKNKNLYQAAKKRGILDELLPGKFKTSWTPELIRQEFKEGDYNSRSDLQIKNKNLYNAAHKYGMLDELLPDKFKTSWTPELIRQEFKKVKYKGRDDLQKKNKNLYYAAYKYGMLDELLPNKLNISWTPDLVRQEFKKGDYNSRGVLRLKNPKLYDVAIRYKMLDELFPRN